MIAEALVTVATWFGILSGVVVVGGAGVAGGKYWMDQRDDRREKNALIDKVNTGLTEVKVDVTHVKDQVGEVKDMATSAAFLAADLKDDVAELRDEHGNRLHRLEVSVDDIKNSLMPNGLKTDNPGDVLQHILATNNALLKAAGLDPEEYNPK